MRALIHRCLVLLAAVSGLSLPSAAQWTASAYIGAAHTQNSFLGIQQPALGTNIRFHDTAYHGESFEPPLYYGVRGGYWFRRYWGAEVEFTHLKVFTKVDHPALVIGILNGASINSRLPIDNIVQRFSISHGVNLLLANVVVHQALWPSKDEKHARAYFALRFGVGATIPHPESTIQNVVDEHYQTGSPVVQLAASFEHRVWGRVYWMGEYKFTRVREKVAVKAGTAVTLLESHHVITGPAIHF
jgi:hypothetical protein